MKINPHIQALYHIKEEQIVKKVYLFEKKGEKAKNQSSSTQFN